jgi:hypothetical protein
MKLELHVWNLCKPDAETLFGESAAYLLAPIVNILVRATPDVRSIEGVEALEAIHRARASRVASCRRKSRSSILLRTPAQQRLELLLFRMARASSLSRVTRWCDHRFAMTRQMLVVANASNATTPSPRRGSESAVSTVVGPSVPPSLLATALVLQTYDSVSDEEAKQRADYDLRWKVALGLEVETRPFAKSTLQEFRAQLILHDQARSIGTSAQGPPGGGGGISDSTRTRTESGESQKGERRQSGGRANQANRLWDR